MNYKTGYCFTSMELYDNFDFNKIKTKRKFWEGDCWSNCKVDLCGKILTYCFYLIILDIINNNITFVLPLVHKDAFIHVKQFIDEEFKRMYRGGKFDGIDFIMSNFKGYQIYFRYKAKEEYREKPIYIDSKLKKIFLDNINRGKEYY